MVTATEDVGTEQVQDGNAEPTSEATPPETVTEPAAVESTEAAPAPDPTPEPTPEPDFSALTSLDDDALSSLEPVKSLLARREESVRQSTKSEADRERRRAEQEWFQRGDFEQDLKGIAQLTGEGDERSIAYDSDKLQGFIGRTMAASQDLAREELSAVISDRLRGSSIPSERVDQLAGLATAVNRGQATPAEFVNAQLDMIRDLEVEARLADAKQEIERELRAEFEQRATVESRRTADEARRSGDAATRGIQGSSGKFFVSQAEVDAAHVSGDLPTSEYAAMRHDGRFDALPRS